MGDPIPALITPLEAHEWALFRSLRLRALAESPDAFSPTLEETEKTDEAAWRRIAGRFADGPGGLLIARPADGLMSATLDSDGVGHIGAMWVAPDARDRRLGSALLDRGIEHLDTLGCTTIELSVTETNTRARKLYESRGFVLTGASEPLREGSMLENLYMRRTG